jgi:hypothetical protein
MTLIYTDLKRTGGDGIGVWYRREFMVATLPRTSLNTTKSQP